MSIVFQGFSIREYVWNMRRVDVEKCWPFNDQVSGDCIESLLPPITVVKYRWWLPELGILRKKEESDKSRAKSKCRVPKKRSIVEIFAMAPQIHAVNDGDEGASMREDVKGRGKVDNSNIALTDFKFKKKKKTTTMMKKTNENKEKKKKTNVMNLLKQKKKIKKKSTEKKFNKIAKKAKIVKEVNKCKRNTQDAFSNKLDAARCRLEIAEGISYMVSLDKNKAGRQGLPTPKKDRTPPSFKSVANDQEPVFPVRSILRNRSKVHPMENASSCNLNAEKLNPLDVQHEKHVRFFDCSDTEETNNISSFDQNMCSVHLNASALSLQKGQSSKSNRGIASIFVDPHTGDVPINAEKGNRVPTGELLSHACEEGRLPNIPRPSFPCREEIRNLQNKPIFPSEAGRHQNDMRVSDCCVQAASHRYWNSGWNLSDNYVDHGQCFAATSSKGTSQELPRPTSSDFTSNEIPRSRAPLLSQPAPQNPYDHPLQHQTVFGQSALQLMSRLCPLPEWKQKPVVFRESHVDDEFPGLPLNSQGELVQVDGTHPGCLDHLRCLGFRLGTFESLPPEKQILSRNMEDFPNLKKHVTDRELAKDHSDLFPEPKLRKKKPLMYLPARLGVDETFSEQADTIWEESDRGYNRTLQSLDSDLNLKSQSFNTCKQNLQIQFLNGKVTTELGENPDHMFLSNTAATMRLMGKDVRVGERSAGMQLSLGRRVSPNEGIISENCPLSLSNSVTDDYLLKGCLLPPLIGNSEKKPQQTFRDQWNKVLQSSTMMKDPAPRFLDPHCNWAAQTSRDFITNQSSNSTIHKVHTPPTSSPMLDKDFNFHGSVLPRGNTLTFNPQLPLLPTPLNTTQRIDYSTSNLSSSPVVSHARKSSLNFPFLYPDSSEYMQPPLLLKSFKRTTPGLLQSTQQVKPTFPPQLFPEASGKWQALVTGPEYHPTISSHQLPLVNYPQDPISSCPNAGNVFVPKSVNGTLFSPAVSGLLPASYIRISKRNRIKVRERMKTKAIGAKDANTTRKTNKRQADVKQYPTKHPKTPNLKMQDHFEAAIDSATKYMNSSMQGNTGAVDLSRDQASMIDFTQKEHQGNDLRASSGIYFCGNGMQAGPIKLSAGAKHVLKPDQDMHKDNLGPVHSTIPLISMTDCDAFAGPHMKSSKICRL